MYVKKTLKKADGYLGSVPYPKGANPSNEAKGQWTSEVKHMIG